MTGTHPSSTTVTGGECEGCYSFNELNFYDCYKVKVESCKDLSNIVIGYSNCEEVKYDDLSGLDKYFYAPEGLKIIDVWVKSGCYQSGDGPGYGRYFQNPNNCGPAICGTSSPTTKSPDNHPSHNPSVAPSVSLTFGPTESPTRVPSNQPSHTPSVAPTFGPTESPTRAPSNQLSHTPSVAPTFGPTESPSRAPILNPSISPTDRPTSNQTTLSPTGKPAKCPPQKPPKIDPCNSWGRSYSECFKKSQQLKGQGTICWWNNAPVTKCKNKKIHKFHIRCWLSGQKEWNTPASKTLRMEKFCSSGCDYGAFAVKVSRYIRKKKKWGTPRAQSLDCQAEWDSRQISDPNNCELRGQWNIWIPPNEDKGSCPTRNADNGKCYSAERKDYCKILGKSSCIIAINCSWDSSKNTCSFVKVTSAKLQHSSGARRADGNYFQDQKQLSGPVIGNNLSPLVLAERGNFNKGFIRMFGFVGCNSEFDLLPGSGKTTLQIKCADDQAYNTVGTIASSAMDQDELREFIIPVPDKRDCSIRLDYEGDGEAFWPSVAMGGFTLST